MPPPVLRAAGFWQKQRFRGRRGGEEDERVRGKEEEEDVEEVEKESIWPRYQCQAVWRWQGRVRPDWLRSLMEVDLESSLPLTDSDCSVNSSRTHSHAPSPRPQSAGGSHTCMRVYVRAHRSHSSWLSTEHQD